MVEQRTYELRVCENCSSDKYEINDSMDKTFVCLDCGHESKTQQTLTVAEVSTDVPSAEASRGGGVDA